MSTSVAPIKASTQEHIDIEDIVDNIIILKDGSCSLVIQVTAINFDLLSETEQDAIIYAYASLLNSLNYPIQIIVQSTIKDVSDYLRLLRKQEQKQSHPLLLKQLQKYRVFIENIVKDNRVLDKKFYIVIPFSKYELGITANSPIPSIKSPEPSLPKPKHVVLEKAKNNLIPKRDHLFRLLGRIGLQAKQLNTQQLLTFAYSYYNQESIGQKFSQVVSYQSPIVQANLDQSSQSQTNQSTQKSNLITN